MKQRNKLNEHTQDLQTLLFLRKEEEHFQLFIPVQISLTLVIVEYLLHLSSRVRMIDSFMSSNKKSPLEPSACMY